MSQASAPGTRRSKRRSRRAATEGVHYPRWFWPSFSLPAIVWLLILFVLPLYTVVSIAFGTVDPILRGPLPVYQPWYWSTEQFGETLDKVFGIFGPVYVHTFEYVFAASAICLVLGYAVAYYVARYGGKHKGLLLVLLISPFWISYLMRMLAWINLLDNDGYVNRFLMFVNVVDHPIGWLEGRSFTVIMGLVYGYIPYMILPLFGFLDRIQSSLLEAGRDLGASPARTFWRVTLPLSKPAIYAGLVIVSLPMFGDYYTQDLLSGSGNTSMIGNIIDDTVRSTPKGSVLVLLLMILLIVPMMYYLRSTLKAQESR